MNEDNNRLTQQVGLSVPVAEDNLMGESAWIEVVQRMDAVYADLVHSQVELEEKNAALEDAQQFINSVLTSISDVLLVCDINGQIQQVNRALEEITGKTQTALKNTSLSGLFTEEFAPLAEGFAEHIRSDALFDCEVEIRGQTEVHPMSINCTARYDHQRRLSGFVITGRPLGELRRAFRELHDTHEQLKAAQQGLIQSEKMASLGRLVAGVAHELNNPISFVFGNMHALKRYEQRFHRYIEFIHQSDNKQQREDLRAELKIDRIMDDIGPLIDGSMEGAERVSEIVQNLSRFANPKERQKGEFNLIQTAQTAAQWVIRASRRKPEIILNMPDSCSVMNSEGHVHQILINLFQNAMDAMEDLDKPQLTLTLKTKEGMVTLSVRDIGPGISTADQLRVFDPFFTTKPVGKGTGLGLYISYGLAKDQCGGNLTVSNHPQGGAVFRLSLPLVATSNALTPTLSQGERENSTQSYLDNPSSFEITNATSLSPFERANTNSPSPFGRGVGVRAKQNTTKDQPK